MAHEENPQRDREMNPNSSGNYSADETPAEHLSAEAAEPELTAQQWLVRNAWILVAAVALLVFLYSRVGVPGLISIAKVAIGLGFVIFIHELGHFLVAKWCGVRVDVFSIGFGPAIPGCRFQWGETTYKIAMIPLGGYVQMLGQVDLQEEDDGSEDDPQSYKNKAVWQRMAIISAGVVMNAILALVCYLVVFLGPGKDRLAPVVGQVDSGSASFTAGIRSGAVFEEINGIENPYFDNLVREVMLSHVLDQKLAITYQQPGKPAHSVQVTPQPDEGGRPKIGVGWPKRLHLVESRFVDEGFETPALPKSAASHANPPLAFDDKIIATTDPDNPKEIKELPLDPRVPKNDPSYGQKDFFEFARRMQQLAGQEVVIRVERTKDGETKTVDITVPPAYNRTLGAIMAMGEITAIRAGSPAATGGIQQQDTTKNRKGDVIEIVEVKEPDGAVTRFTHQPEEPKKKAARLSAALAGDLFMPTLVQPALLYEEVVKHAGVKEQWLDPVRLPDQLKAWANRMAAAKKERQDWHVTLLVRRHNDPKVTPKEFTRQEVKLEWDKSWEFEEVSPLSPDAPMPIAELGLGYQIKTTVVHADPQFKSETEDRLQPGDVIEQVQLHQIINQKDEVNVGEWYDLAGEKKESQWAHVASQLHTPSIIKVLLKVNRNGETTTLTLIPQDVEDWYQQERGLALMRDMREQKASNPLEAISMGFKETVDRVTEIFIVLRGLMTGRVPTQSIGGPVAIAHLAYQQASFDFWEFVVFIGFISINLAVINFLPIPVLDGGHMVFLTYELIRGKPASERIRAIATYAGFLFIVGLFIFITFNDITNLIFGRFP